jgi:hypothetical protein
MKTDLVVHSPQRARIRPPVTYMMLRVENETSGRIPMSNSFSSEVFSRQEKYITDAAVQYEKEPWMKEVDRA